MQRRRHSDWLKAFVDYASFGEAPLSMYFWTGVSTLAGALRRRVWIDQAYFQWIPNFYVIFVAPPGIVAKSTTASVGMNLLRAVPGVKFGPDVVTWQALAQSFAGALEFVEMPDGLQHGMSALMIESSELGTFLNPQDKEMVDFLVTLWDGKKGAVKKVTKTQGQDLIENPCINIIACTTPAWIEGNFPEYMVGGGFTSRCIFVYAGEKRQYVPYPALAVPKDFAIMQQSLIDDLVEIATLKGPFVLLPETIEWGNQWYRDHYANRPAHLDNDRFGGYIARKQTHIHKLAMVVSAARKSTLEINVDDLQTANAIITSLEGDMPRVFDRIGMTDETRGAGLLVSYAQKANGGILSNTLYGLLFRDMSYTDYESALNSAVKANKVELLASEKGFVVRATGK
jgi:Protein of unknown function (DUF3987)